MATLFFVYTLAIRNRGQQLEHRFSIFGRQDIFFCLPWFPQTAFWMLQKHMHSRLLCGWGWKMVGCYCAMNLNWQKLSIIFPPTLFLEVASISGLFQSSKIGILHRFCQCKCCVGRKQIPGAFCSSICLSLLKF